MKGAAVFEITDGAQPPGSPLCAGFAHNGVEVPSAATEESSQLDKISIDRGADETTFIRSLANATDETEIGGKARNLARLIALGVPVPAGVVITRAAFDRFLQLEPLCGCERGVSQAGTRRRIGVPDARRGCAWRGDRNPECEARWISLEPLGLELDPSNPDQLRGISEGIRMLLMSTPFSPEIQCAIDAIARELLPESVLAVRSSAVGEDGDRASFAGQFDSILGVSTKAALEDAVRACWASYWSERALYYQAARQVTTGGMGVIVQRQVEAGVSGVLFTRSPDGTDDLVIEYCAGLGDALVAGRIDPERLVVSRADLSVRNHAPNGILTIGQVLELVLLALRLERELGGPQDIEWAIDREGQLWILQARPITILPANKALGGEKTQPRADVPHVLWSNANVNENFPQPISPLLYSIASSGYYHYFRNLGRAFGLSRGRLEMMDGPLGAIIGVHGGRMYYNLTSIHAVLRMAPFGDRLTSAFNQFVGADEVAVQPSDAAEWGHRRGRVHQFLELLRIGAMTTWQYLFLRRRIESFEQTADEFAAHTKPDKLRGRPLSELLEDLHSFLEIRCHRWKNASLADAASMVCYSLLQQSLAEIDAAPGLHNRLLRALPGVPSSIPPLRLWELSRIIRSDAILRKLFASADAARILDAIRRDQRFAAFRRAFDQFLEDWGFRSSLELMLTMPSLQEDPIPAIELLKAYAASDVESPELAISRQAEERLAETSRVLRRLARRSPFKAAWVWLLLRWTQRAVAYRERARLKQALLYNRCRLVALAIGDRFVQAGFLCERDDVFMLTWQETCELGSGRAMFPYHVSELIALRRHEHAELAAMHLPDTMRLRNGCYFSVDRVHDGQAASAMLEASAMLCGTGASGGVVTACAAVLSDVREADRLKRGEVLVTRQTDPGWAPVFGLISGLVIERGGLLSHGAIIAREFGLPCVVGIKDAMRRIAPGTIVTVNGDQGTVALAECSSEFSGGKS